MKEKEFLEGELRAIYPFSKLEGSVSSLIYGDRLRHCLDLLKPRCLSPGDDTRELPPVVSG